MSLNLPQTALGQVDLVNTADAIEAALEDTQGNILKSNGRDNNVHLFLKFTGAPADALAWLRMMGTQHVTSAWQQSLDAKAHRETGADGGVFVNLCLSAAGYTALGLTAAMPDDASFRAGAKAAVQRLSDPPVAEWQSGFQQEIHALVIVAADDAADTATAAQAISATLSGVADVVDQEVGAALRVNSDGVVTTDGSGTVHEHFGFADGVSQPLFFQDEIDAERLNSGGFDRYDPSAPLDLVLLKDPGGGPNGYGSYFVYRKLQQNVAGFRGDEAKLATALAEAARGKDATPTPTEQKLSAAYLVGRFRDGTPVVQQGVDGWTNEPNNFNFAADVDGIKCPFHAHIRKTNPRGDKVQQFGAPPGEDRARRIARRAVSFGPLTLDPPADQPVGLLFMCAQSSIANQFEFMQAIWANLTSFLRPGTGLDPIIGEAPPGAADVPQQFPRVYGLFNELSFATDPPTEQSPFAPYQFGKWVTMLGGEYFFLPSLSFLTSAGATS
jgi:Dyp-type peroxidase family